MGSRLLLLRRGDHNSRLTEGFESLLDKESMTDVSIACGQQIIRAHRTILSIFSPFFKRIFDSLQNPIHYPFVVLKDMPLDDLRAIIDLMYRGQVTVTQDRFPSLRRSAKALEVKELSDIISSYEQQHGLAVKTELDDSSSSTSGTRSSRKRGRPRRYGEDRSDCIDDLLDLKPIFPSVGPPTKRQQVLMSKQAAKQPTASRGGGIIGGKWKQTAAKSTTPRGSAAKGGVGGHSLAFQKPQIATRGGASTATTSRGRGIRYTTPDTVGADADQDYDPNDNDKDYDPNDDDDDYYPQQDWNRKSGGRKGGRRSARPSGDFPLATQMMPKQIDLGDVLPNSLVSSSSTTGTERTVAIKLEPDSDSEVECIMSAMSPLPSDVVDDPIVQDNEPEIARFNTLQPPPQPSDELSSTSNQILTTSDQMVTTSLAEPSTLVDTSLDVEMDVTNVRIKSERPDTPVDHLLAANSTDDNAVQLISDDIMMDTREQLPSESTTTQSLSNTVDEQQSTEQPVSTSGGTETMISELDPYIIVKTERSVSPFDDELQSFIDELDRQQTASTSAPTSAVCNPTDPIVSHSQPVLSAAAADATPVTESTQSPTVATLPAATVNVTLNNSETINVPIIRFIKTERQSPPPPPPVVDITSLDTDTQLQTNLSDGQVIGTEGIETISNTSKEVDNNNTSFLTITGEPINHSYIHTDSSDGAGGSGQSSTHVTNHFS